MAQPKKEVLVSKPFSSRVQLPTLPNMELLACGAELGRPHLHLISNGKGVAFGKLELVACYAKASTPSEYQLATVSRHYVLELDMEENEEMPAARGGRAIWAEFRGEPRCKVYEACPTGANAIGSQPKNIPAGARKRLEVEVSSVLDIFTASSQKESPPEEGAKEEAMGLRAPPENGEQTGEDTALRPEPRQNSPSQAASVPVGELERSSGHILNGPIWLGPHPEPRSNVREKPDGLLCRPSYPQEITRPFSHVPWGAETISPHVWRMPGRG